MQRSLVSALILVICFAASGRAADASGAGIIAATNRLTDLLSAPDSVRHQGLRRLLDEWVDWTTLTHAMYGDYVRQSLGDYTRAVANEDVDLLAEHREKRLQRALRRRTEEDIENVLEERSIRAVHVVGYQVRDRRAYVDLLLLGPGTQLQVRGLLDHHDDGWRFVELRWGKETLRKHYTRAFSDILHSKYSTATLEGALLQRSYLVLDDFSDTPAGRVPLDWGIWRDKDKVKSLPYHVAKEEGYSYLAAADSGQSVILGKFEHWNPRRYPIMTWCWRARALPPGGDERGNDTNDSAAGVYVIFSQNWLGVPKQLKYVWSTTLPQGTIGRRNLLFRPWFFVLESGDDKLGRWVFEQVDLAAHHKLKLGGRPPHRTIGLGILTDANSTRSYAAADYTDFRVWTQAALEAGEIHDYCDCLNSGPKDPGGHQPFQETSP